MKADDIFQSLARAEQNYRYWNCIVERLYRRRKYADFAIAICSSSVPITIGVLEKQSFIWKGLACVSAFVSIWAASFNLKEELKAATELKGRWYQLLIEYEALWEDTNDGPDELATDIKTAFQKLRKRQADLEPLEPGITYDKKLGERCYQEVCQNRGLATFPEEKPNVAPDKNASKEISSEEWVAPKKSASEKSSS
jgi:hypothetical protein